jgi:hypothetical protein
MSDTVLMVGIALMRSSVQAEGTLEERIRGAFEVVRDRVYLTTDDDVLMRCALGAVLEVADGDERARVILELDHLRSLSAALSGVPVDLGSLSPLENPIGLMKLWHEATNTA